MYDPSAGRWLSSDPLGIDGGDPNLYRYSGNDPVNNTDPSGLATALTAEALRQEALAKLWPMEKAGYDLMVTRAKTVPRVKENLRFIDLQIQRVLKKEVGSGALEKPAEFIAQEMRSQIKASTPEAIAQQEAYEKAGEALRKEALALLSPMEKAGYDLMVKQAKTVPRVKAYLEFIDWQILRVAKKDVGLEGPAEYIVRDIRARIKESTPEAIAKQEAAEKKSKEEWERGEPMRKEEQRREAKYLRERQEEREREEAAREEARRREQAKEAAELLAALRADWKARQAMGQLRYEVGLPAVRVAPEALPPIVCQPFDRSRVWRARPRLELLDPFRNLSSLNEVLKPDFQAFRRNQAFARMGKMAFEADELWPGLFLPEKGKGRGFSLKFAQGLLDVDDTALTAALNKRILQHLTLSKETARNLDPCWAGIGSTWLSVGNAELTIVDFVALAPADFLASLTLDIYFRVGCRRPAMYGFDPNWRPPGKTADSTESCAVERFLSRDRRQFNPLGVKAYNPLTDAWDAQGFLGLGKFGWAMGEHTLSIPERYAQTLREGNQEEAMRAGLEAYFLLRAGQHAPGQLKSMGRLTKRGLLLSGRLTVLSGRALVKVLAEAGQQIYLGIKAGKYFWRR